MTIGWILHKDDGGVGSQDPLEPEASLFGKAVGEMRCMFGDELLPSPADSPRGGSSASEAASDDFYEEGSDAGPRPLQPEGSDGEDEWTIVPQKPARRLRRQQMVFPVEPPAPLPPPGDVGGGRFPEQVRRVAEGPGRQ